MIIFYILKRKKEASSVGIEPTTSRLTVERANRLRHEDVVSARILSVYKKMTFFSVEFFFYIVE